MSKLSQLSLLPQCSGETSLHVNKIGELTSVRHFQIHKGMQMTDTMHSDIGIATKLTYRIELYNLSISGIIILFLKHLQIIRYFLP